MNIYRCKHYPLLYYACQSFQRVALARSIVRQPKILLLDEPLSALDDAMRFKLQEYIFKAHQQYKLTTILVSHHLPEIFKLSDKVIVLDKGKILKQGKPADVFSGHKISSSKFKVIGEIVEILKSDLVYIVCVLVSNEILFKGKFIELFNPNPFCGYFYSTCSR
jgi:molybdate transport system ATP-binding protein